MLRLKRYFLLLLALGVSGPEMVSATVVRFDIDFGGQPAGSIFLDLFDTDAPITVANFLNYIDDGAGNRRYDGSFIHRRAPGFAIQGGGYAYDPGLGEFSQTSVSHIEEDAPIQNEFDNARSNVRGTIAMAKLGGDPDSATSEWFINLADNSGEPANLDTQNGGFTVFGQILGNGMQLVDSIEALSAVNLGSPFANLPVVDSSATVDEANLITLSQVVVDPPAAISADSVAIDYGLAALGDGPVTRTMTIQNIGAQDLVLGTVGETDNLAAPFSFPVGGDACSGQTLVSKAVCTIDIVFEPTAFGDFQDSLDVPSSDADQPSLTIEVSGIGVSETPVLDVDPLALDFGTAGTGQQQTRTVTVRNFGGGQLQPLGASISGADSGAFSIADDTCNTVVLNIGETCVLSVELTSFSLGALTAALEVLADPGNQTVQIGLSADVTLLEPKIVLPVSVVVPDIRFNVSGSASLEITNTGIDDLYVSAIELLGTDAALFALSTSNCIDVAITPQSQPCVEQIGFNPSIAGEFDAILRVSSNDPDSPSIDVPVNATASSDDDGISDAVEQAAPNNGDANQDGIADAEQAEVASLPTVNGEYVTLETSAGTFLNVQAVGSASLTNIPATSAGSLEFAHGFFLFTIDDVPQEPGGSGGRAEVTLHLPAGRSANSYFKFGWQPNDSFLASEHWYLFSFNQSTQTGAEFIDNRVILHLVDGGGGDHDRTVNGRIVDPGGPAVLPTDSGGSGGGGCSLRRNTAAGVYPMGLDLLFLFIGLLAYRAWCLTRLRFPGRLV